MNVPSTKQRRSLKGALRTILLKCRRQGPEDMSSTVGSGILRRDPSLPALPNDSTTAFILGLDSTNHDNEYEGNDIPDRFDISSLATSAAMSSTRTLMPKLSLSQFDIYHPPIQETRYLQRGRCNSIASSLVEGASYQASLVTLSSFRSASTLRIQSSVYTLRSESDHSCSQLSFPEKIDHNFSPLIQSSATFFCPSPPRSNHTISPSRSVLRKKASIGAVSSPRTLRQLACPAFEYDHADLSYFLPYDYSKRFSRPLSVIEEVASYNDELGTPHQSPVPSFREMTKISTPELRESHRLRTPSTKNDSMDAVLVVKHFSSFCALDTINPGCPVTATSEDLRYIFELGENFCLNNQGCEDISMDVITGADTAGNPVTHLVLFSPLIIPHSGRSRFMLASLVDMTDFLHDTVSLPELEMISEESVESDPPTPRCRPQSSPKLPKYQLSAESLLGGCFVDEPRTPVRRYDEDIWLNLATEERKQHSRQSRLSSGSGTPISATSTTSSSFGGILEEFMCQLQELYSDFFLLAKSPLDDTYYEICNVSPRVYENRDYVNGHLSQTSATDMSNLSSRLAGDDAFDMEVRWGTEGIPKHLYCIPLFARSAVTWICFLVAAELPVLW